MLERRERRSLVFMHRAHLAGVNWQILAGTAVAKVQDTCNQHDLPHQTINDPTAQGTSA